jgi:hypothetical protein
MITVPDVMVATGSRTANVGYPMVGSKRSVSWAASENADPKKAAGRMRVRILTSAVLRDRDGRVTM